MTSRNCSAGNYSGQRSAVSRRSSRCLLTAVICCLLTAVCYPLNAQSKSQLEKDKAKVEKEIKNLNTQLSKAKKNSRSGQQQINLLEKKIGERTKLINNINGQMNLLGIEMMRTQDSIALLHGEIDSLKAEYAKVVRVLYAQRGNIDKTVLLLDPNSYNTTYLRMKYFRDYSRYRRRQAAFIKDKERQLNDVSVDLARQHMEQSNLLVQQKRQKEALANEQREHKQNLKKSKQQEKDLQAQITKKEKQKQQLQQQIQRIINEEIARANKAKKQTATTTTGKPKETSNANADVALSADFASNKGRLPWPVSYTKVIRGYGRYTHESGGQNMNNGIDLQCKSGASVQCVFDGTVSRVFICPNGTKGIIVRHGDYMTVYANLATVTVKEGANVKTKQNLGAVYTNADGVAEFSFQLWKNTSSQNPTNWLK